MKQFQYLINKSKLAGVAILADPDPDQQLCLIVGTYTITDGATLNCSTSRSLKPLAFFSRKLSATLNKI